MEFNTFAQDAEFIAIATRHAWTISDRDLPDNNQLKLDLRKYVRKYSLSDLRAGRLSADLVSDIASLFCALEDDNSRRRN